MLRKRRLPSKRVRQRVVCYCRRLWAPPLLLATFLELPYAQVAFAALIPALLYFFALFLQLDAHAARHGLVGLPESDVPRLRDVLKSVGVFAVVWVAGLFYWYSSERRWRRGSPAQCCC